MKKIWCLIFLMAACYMKGSRSSVFLREKDASDVLRIRKRANFMFEEVKPGNLERECFEEKCVFEEANEIHSSLDKTLIFWNKYVDGDQCNPNLCVNNSTCQDLIGGYQCHCAEGFDGPQCQYVLLATNCSDNYGYCAHFCSEIPERNRRECSCAAGYKLSEDGISCNASDKYPCGLLKGVKASQQHEKGKRERMMKGKVEGPGNANRTDSSEEKGGPLGPRIIKGEVMKKGGSPWQVLLMTASGKFICGGVLIHQFWVLTAAHCVHKGERFRAKLGEHNRSVNEYTEDTILVNKVYVHPSFNLSNMDSDIALLRLSEVAVFTDYIIPVCLPTKEMAERKLLIANKNVVITGWGAMDENDDRYRPNMLLFISIKLTSYKLCKEKLKDRVTDNMICAGNPGSRKDACRGDSGGPMVTVLNGTWFLLGLVSWGEGCGRFQTFGVYTKVTNYLNWIYSTINAVAT
ncbi:vitamin K-dependent protein C-like [Chiloscyllium punctatum]